jgi:hypothetical protein
MAANPCARSSGTRSGTYGQIGKQVQIDLLNSRIAAILCWPTRRVAAVLEGDRTARRQLDSGTKLRKCTEGVFYRVEMPRGLFSAIRDYRLFGHAIDVRALVRGGIRMPV